MKKDKTFDMSQSDQAHIKNYTPLLLGNDFYEKNIPSFLATEILNVLTNKNFSKSKWKKSKDFKITWKKKHDEIINAITSFDRLAESLRKDRKYDFKKLMLPPIPISWLDQSIEVGMPFYAPENGGDGSLTFELGTNLGKAFPIKPKIDREGFISGSFQNTLINMLLYSRNEVIRYSQHMFDASNGIWLSKLMNFLNISVSVVEITLIKLYYKAKYDKVNDNWSFDEEKIGTTTTGRIDDKLNWIYKITGIHLPDISREKRTFQKIKRIRNHLNHFDPPIFAYTIEDASEWLNSIFDITFLLLKIRKTINSHISPKIIKILLQPMVKYEPKDPKKIRHPQKNTGYISCINGKAELSENSAKIKKASQ